MDFHAAMETFAEAWVAANTQTVVNPEGQVKLFFCLKLLSFDYSAWSKLLLSIVY